jgi:CRP-like cAMP-binding protein
MSNRLLELTAASDLELIEPHLERVQSAKGEVCIEPFQPIHYVYFLDGGLGSTVIPDGVSGISDVGMQGYEGLIGVPAILGVDQSPHKVFMQVGGPMRKIRIEPLRLAMDRSPAFRDLLLSYVHVFLLQTAQTAHVNARFKVEERLARWILMAADRLGPELALTHEYLSNMLGVRRPSVTEALHILEGERLITSKRNHIVARDRAGLEALAGFGYGIAEAEYRRLISGKP